MRMIGIMIFSLFFWCSMGLAAEPAATPNPGEQRRAKLEEMRVEMRKLEDKQREEVRTLRDKHLKEERELRDRHKKDREELRTKYK